MIKVVKFGGSSLASAEQFAKVGKIIHADKERRYVVANMNKVLSGQTIQTENDLKKIVLSYGVGTGIGGSSS